MHCKLTIEQSNMIKIQFLMYEILFSQQTVYYT